MTFSNAVEVRKSITLYALYIGVALNYVKYESNIIRVKCEDECPFVLLVSKDDYNHGLPINTLVQDQNWLGFSLILDAQQSFLRSIIETKFLISMTTNLRT